MELTTAMGTTGTCRSFRPDPVPDEVLHRAFDSARFAPQGGNRQPVRWVVVREARRKQALADLYLPLWRSYRDRVGDAAVTSPERSRAVERADRFAESFSEVPAILVLCAETEALHATDAELDRLSVVGGASVYPTMQNACLALRDQGVATAVTTLLCREETAVRELLGIPERFLTAAHIAAGYPERGFPARLSRKPVRDTVFAEQFGTPFDVAGQDGHQI